MSDKDDEKQTTGFEGSGGITPKGIAWEHGHPPPEPILQFFESAHLPDHLREISEPFGNMAHWLVKQLPRNPERTTALRKLLEAKDCAVRARLYRE